MLGSRVMIYFLVWDPPRQKEEWGGDALDSGEQDRKDENSQAHGSLGCVEGPAGPRSITLW